MGKKRESLLVDQIKKRLNSEDKSFFFKIHGGIMQMAGIADLIGVYKGRFIAIEVKLPENKKGVTKLQAWFLDKVNDAGGEGFVATGLPDVLSRLEI